MSAPNTKPDPRPSLEGWKPVWPGIYEDRNGDIHFAVPELLAVFGAEDNAENRRIIEEEVRRIIRVHWPHANVEVRE